MSNGVVVGNDGCGSCGCAGDVTGTDGWERGGCCGCCRGDCGVGICCDDCGDKDLTGLDVTVAGSTAAFPADLSAPAPSPCLSASLSFIIASSSAASCCFCAYGNRTFDTSTPTNPLPPPPVSPLKLSLLVVSLILLYSPLLLPLLLLLLLLLLSGVTVARDRMALVSLLLPLADEVDTGTVTGA